MLTDSVICSCFSLSVCLSLYFILSFLVSRFSVMFLFVCVLQPTTEALFAIVHKHVSKAADDFSGGAKTIVQAAVGADKYATVQRDVADKIVDALPHCLSQVESYTDRALDMENTLFTKMAALPPEQFERLLHPVFEEDEWKLVLMGGVLGVLIGFAQYFVLPA